MNASEIADRIDEAADLIGVRGRTTRVMSDSDGRLCVYGSFFAVSVEHCASDAGLLYEAFYKFFGSGPVNWNDSLPVNAENDALVIDTLKRCAKSLRESACS